MAFKGIMQQADGLMPDVVSSGRILMHDSWPRGQAREKGK